MKINKVIKMFQSGRGNWRIFAIGSQILTCAWGDVGSPEPTDEEVLMHIVKNYGGPSSPGGWHVARPYLSWHARTGLEALAEGRRSEEFDYVEQWVNTLFDGDAKAAFAYSKTLPTKPVPEAEGGCFQLSI